MFEKLFSVRWLCSHVNRFGRKRKQHPPIVEDWRVDERSHDGISSQGWLIDVLRGVSLQRSEHSLRMGLNVAIGYGNYQEFPRDCLLRKFRPHVQTSVYHSISCQRIFVEEVGKRSQQLCHCRKLGAFGMEFLYSDWMGDGCYYLKRNCLIQNLPSLIG